MNWTVEYLDTEVQADLEAMPAAIRASFARIVGMIQTRGLPQMREPYVKHLDGPVWEMRMTGKEGIARAAYVTTTGRRVVVVHVFAKKTQKMTRKFIPVQESINEWMKDPEFVAAYDALEEEFTLASALIEARTHADMTQEQVAQAMGTSQTAIARLESGRSKPSTQTLQKFAKATGMRLRISFEPQQPSNQPRLL